MSEQEHEQDIPFEEPEPDAAGTGADDDAETEEVEQEGAEPVEPDQGEQASAAEPQLEPAALTDKEIEARYKKLDKLRETTAGRVADILGEDAVAVDPCPLCSEGIIGHVPAGGAGQVPPDVFAAVQRYLGLPDPETFAEHPDFQRCPDCKGRGEVITGSVVPNQMLTGCPRCATRGWIGKNEASAPAATNGHTEPAPVVTGPTVMGSELPPELEYYREKGYMIVPPAQPVAPMP